MKIHNGLVPESKMDGGTYLMNRRTNRSNYRTGSNESILQLRFVCMETNNPALSGHDLQSDSKSAFKDETGLLN